LDNICVECYMTGAQFFSNALVPKGPPDPKFNDLSVLTICLMQTKNGFTVIGKSAPADPINYNQTLGMEFAREDAIKQLWPLMGYALREKLVGEKV
jgi:hypothetical protein